MDYSWLDYPFSIDYHTDFRKVMGCREKIIDEIQSGVVITVDNGISAHKAIKKAKEKGLTVIVTGSSSSCYARG